MFGISCAQGILTGFNFGPPPMIGDLRAWRKKQTRVSQSRRSHSSIFAHPVVIQERHRPDRRNTQPYMRARGRRTPFRARAGPDAAGEPHAQGAHPVLTDRARFGPQPSQQNAARGPYRSVPTCRHRALKPWSGGRLPPHRAANGRPQTPGTWARPPPPCYSAHEPSKRPYVRSGERTPPLSGNPTDRRAPPTIERAGHDAFLRSHAHGDRGPEPPRDEKEGRRQDGRRRKSAARGRSDATRHHPAPPGITAPARARIAVTTSARRSG